MIIRSIRIKEGLFSRFIEFSANANLIHSKQNSKGKTTLLRFLLYSLGYNIPNTRKIKFERCEVETVVYTEKKYSLQGTTQGRYLTGGVPPVRFSM